MAFIAKDNLKLKLQAMQKNVVCMISVNSSINFNFIGNWEETIISSENLRVLFHFSERCWCFKCTLCCAFYFYICHLIALFCGFIRTGCDLEYIEFIPLWTLIHQSVLLFCLIYDAKQFSRHVNQLIVANTRLLFAEFIWSLFGLNCVRYANDSASNR